MLVFTKYERFICILSKSVTRDTHLVDNGQIIGLLLQSRPICL